MKKTLCVIGMALLMGFAWGSAFNKAWQLRKAESVDVVVGQRILWTGLVGPQIEMRVEEISLDKKYLNVRFQNGRSEWISNRRDNLTPLAQK